MKKNYLLGLLILTMSCFYKLQAQTTLTLPSVADANVWSRSDLVNTNWGAATDLEALAWTWNAQGFGVGTLRALLKFDTDQIPTGAVIQSATLNLFGDPNHWGGSSSLSGSNVGWLQRVTGTWNESTVTWNNQPATTTTNHVTIPQSTSRNENYNLDVKQLVLDLLSNGNNGFMIRLQTEQYYRSLVFGSRENTNTNLRPTLTITYNCPSFTVDPITGNSSVCADQYLPLSNTTTGGVWSSSNTSVATVNNGWVTGAAAGTSTISYAVTSNGCTNTVTKDITVNSKLTFAIVGASTVCPNTSGNAYTVSPAVSGADYTWNIQDGPNVGVNFPVNGSTNTTLSIPNSVANNQFTLRCQGLNACGASEIVSKVISLNTDVPPAPDVTCSGTSGTNNCVNLVVTNYGSNSIEWIVGGVVQSTSATFTRPLGTAVLCTYTSASGCTKSTWYSPAVVCTYAARLNNARLNNANTDNSQPASTDNEFTLFPNPNNGTFTLTTNGYNGRALILNMLGVVVEEVQVNENSNTYNIQMTDKPKGSYIIKLTGGNKDHVSLFIVQ